MKKTGHDGFPVTDNKGCVKGMITAFDLLLKNQIHKDLKKGAIKSNAGII